MQTDIDPRMLENLNLLLGSARGSDFYRNKLPTNNIQNKAEWQGLPLTTKADLQSAYPFKMLAVPHNRVSSYHESSGTSILGKEKTENAVPTSSMFSEGDWNDIAERFLRNAVHWTSRDRLLIKTPYSMVTTAHQAHRAAQRCGALIVPADNRSSIMSYTRVIRLLKDLGLTTTWSLPTEPIIWALVARSLGLNPATDFPFLRSMLVAGEPLSAGKRQRISDLWGGIPVFQDYGSTETGSLAGDCDSGHLHLWNDRIYFEVVDKHGNTSETGTGRLIVTPLFKEAMPLIRYEMGDIVTISADACSCGSATPTIAVHGRGSELGDLTQSTMDDLVYSLPLNFDAHMWRAKNHPDFLEVELAGDLDTGDDISDELAHRIFVKTGKRASVKVVAVVDFLGASVFAQQSVMQKPKFLFRPEESWASAFSYQ